MKTKKELEQEVKRVELSEEELKHVTGGTTGYCRGNPCSKCGNPTYIPVPYNDGSGLHVSMMCLRCRTVYSVDW